MKILFLTSTTVKSPRNLNILSDFRNPTFPSSLGFVNTDGLTKLSSVYHKRTKLPEKSHRVVDRRANTNQFGSTAIRYFVPDKKFIPAEHSIFIYTAWNLWGFVFFLLIPNETEDAAQQTGRYASDDWHSLVWTPRGALFFDCSCTIKTDKNGSLDLWRPWNIFDTPCFFRQFYTRFFSIKQ